MLPARTVRDEVDANHSSPRRLKEKWSFDDEFDRRDHENNSEAVLGTLDKDIMDVKFVS
jgi:hypothetical protein